MSTLKYYKITFLFHALVISKSYWRLISTLSEKAPSCAQNVDMNYIAKLTGIFLMGNIIFHGFVLCHFHNFLFYSVWHSEIKSNHINFYNLITLFYNLLYFSTVAMNKYLFNIISINLFNLLTLFIYSASFLSLFSAKYISISF